MRDGGEEKRGGVARRVVGQERPQVLADGVLYYMYAKHRDTVTRTQTNVFIFRHFNPFYCPLKYISFPDHSSRHLWHICCYLSCLSFELSALNFILIHEIHDNSTQLKNMSSPSLVQFRGGCTLPLGLPFRILHDKVRVYFLFCVFMFLFSIWGAAVYTIMRMLCVIRGIQVS